LIELMAMLGWLHDLTETDRQGSFVGHIWADLEIRSLPLLEMCSIIIDWGLGRQPAIFPTIPPGLARKEGPGSFFSSKNPSKALLLLKGR